VDPPDWLVELDLPIAEIAALPARQLKQIAHSVGVTGFSKMTRDRLIAEIIEASEGDRMRFWRRIQADLVEMGVMTRADGDALAALCNNLARYVECERVIRASGMVYEFETKNGANILMQRPEVGIGNAALMMAMRLMDRFGLNPAYRSKLKTEAQQEADGLDELRRKNGRGAAG
jgi:P27 family predicted phage terminase small subunit